MVVSPRELYCHSVSSRPGPCVSLKHRSEDKCVSDLIIIIKSNHYCHHFPLLFVWGGSTNLCCRFHIYSEKAGVCFLYYCEVLWTCAQIIETIIAWWSYSFVCTLRYRIITIMLNVFNFRYMLTLSIVCLWIKSILSIIFHAIYGFVCIQQTYFSCDDCENTCTRSYNLHQIGSMNHLPWLGHETMVCAAFRFMFLY